MNRLTGEGAIVTGAAALAAADAGSIHGRSSVTDDGEATR